MQYLPFGEKIMIIGPVDPEIALLNLKKRKLKVKYIARSAGLPSRLNNFTITTACKRQGYDVEPMKNRIM